MSISIGPVRTRNRVLLAPMAGVTDAPFRAAAWRNGAGLVITEMVAGEELARGRKEMERRARSLIRIHPFVLQLAGREARWMEEGARIARDLGADVIDINMGCPSRMVAGKLSGAALMRDPERALRLVEAVVRGAGDAPVTLKMRLGWDVDEITAPKVARLAEGAGVRMITVHGRTRNQFYRGRADWGAVRQVVDVVSIPVVVNGDIVDEHSARAALAASGAAAVMVGRGCQGRPWFAGELAERLEPGSGIPPLSLAEQIVETRRLYEDMLAFHDASHGVRVARKHLAWALERWSEAGLLPAKEMAAWRARLVREENADRVRAVLDELAAALLEREAA